MVARGIIGNYLIEHELGRGGMGIVYAARHRVLGRPAAIKLLLADTTSRPDRVERFFNEARAAMAIQHPGIVQVYDVGIAEDGRAYLAMELLAGRTLTAVLERGPLPLRVAVAHARQLAEALAAAHAAGVIHRDLKPDNIFVVDGEQRLKLVDFGIAKLAQPVNVRTATGALIGTPLYMSPEQCEAVRELDARSDLYSLGCVLFAMLTGGPPFGDNAIAAHLHTPPPLLRSRCPSASPALEAVVSQLLAKSRDDRFRDANALLAALRQPEIDALASGGNAAMTADAPAFAPPPAPALAPPTPYPVPAPPRPAAADVRVAYPAHAPTQATGTRGPAAPEVAAVAMAPGHAPAPGFTPRRRNGLLFALLGLGGLAIVIGIVLATRACAPAPAVVLHDAPRALEPDAVPPDVSLVPDATLTRSVRDGGLDVAALFDAGRPEPGARKLDAGTRPRPDGGTPPVPADAPVALAPDAPLAPPPPDAPEPIPQINVEIVFARESFSVSSDAIFERLAELARAHPQLQFEVIAEADDDESRNPASLAAARANAVFTRLASRIARSRIQVQSKVVPAGSGRRSARVTYR